jgi:hypothetical protein
MAKENAEKRVLLVAHHYPPDGSSSGVLRPLKFSKYLSRYGWKPHVLTLKESLYAVRDDTLMGQIPEDVMVHRTVGLDSSRHLSIKGRYLAALSVPDRFVMWLPFAVAAGVRAIKKYGIRAIYSTSPPPTTHLIALGLKKLTGI